MVCQWVMWGDQLRMKGGWCADYTHTHLYLVDFGKYLSVSQGNNLLFSTKGLDKHKKVSYKDLAWGLEHVLFITHFHHSILSVECSSLGSIP